MKSRNNPTAGSCLDTAAAEPTKVRKKSLGNNKKKPPLSRAVSYSVCEEPIEEEGQSRSNTTAIRRKQSLPAATSTAPTTAATTESKPVASSSSTSSSSLSSKTSLSNSSSSVDDNGSMLGTVLNQGVIRIPRKKAAVPTAAAAAADYMKAENSRTSLRMKEREEFRQEESEDDD